MAKREKVNLKEIGGSISENCGQVYSGPSSSNLGSIPTGQQKRLKCKRNLMIHIRINQNVLVDNNQNGVQ